MKKLIVLIFIFSSLLYSQDKSKYDFDLIIKADYYTPTFQESFQFGGGTKIDIIEDLQNEDTDKIFTPYVAINYHGHYFEYQYLTYDFDNSLSHDKDLKLASYTFKTNKSIDSSISTNYHFMRYKKSFLYDDWFVGASLLNYNRSITIQNGINKTKLDIQYYIPTVSLDISHDIFFMHINYGGNAGIINQLTSYYDYYISLGTVLESLGDLEINLGFRGHELEVKTDTYNSLSTVDGGYIEIKKAF
jgi:hypothetical protein